jgi:8-oxo-dGTP pyrophosphatase MutT (NUDIX family)
VKKWRTTDSKILVEDRWIKLRADTCVTAEGHTITPFYVLEYSAWANCFVIDDNNDVIMVKHYRHGVDEFVIETVSGGIEESDNSHTEGIRRELAEELGYTGGEIYQTGISYPNPSSQNNKLYSFIAIGGSCSIEQNLEAGESLEIYKLSFEEFLQHMNDTNIINHSLSLTTILLALNFMKRSGLDSIQDLKKLL